MIPPTKPEPTPPTGLGERLVWAFLSWLLIVAAAVVGIHIALTVS